MQSTSTITALSKPGIGRPYIETCSQYTSGRWAR